MPLLRLLITLLFALAPLARADAPLAKAPPALTLRVKSTGWNSQPADVRAVCLSAADQLLPNFPGVTLEPVYLTNGGGPITLFAREPSGAIRVKLDTGDNRWAQCAFQFAHELTHVLCRYRAGANANKWLEESLCEAGSLYALRRMGEAWQTKPPYPNWTPYAEKLTDYAQQRITAHALPAGQSLKTWYPDNAAALRKLAEDRPRDTTVAVALLPLLEKNPAHWAAVHYLNEGLIRADESLPDCLARWHAQTPKEHQPFVRAVADAFGIPLAPK